MDNNSVQHEEVQPQETHPEVHQSPRQQQDQQDIIQVGNPPSIQSNASFDQFPNPQPNSHSQQQNCNFIRPQLVRRNQTFDSADDEVFLQNVVDQEDRYLDNPETRSVDQNDRNIDKIRHDIERISRQMSNLVVSTQESMLKIAE